MRNVIARRWSAITRIETSAGSSDARAVAPAGALADRVEDRREQVGVVVRELALDHRGDALEAHAGVDRRRGQRVQRAVGLPIELHEDVVPDLDVAIAAAVDAAARAAARSSSQGICVAPVVVDLRAAAAGTGVAHLPEVLGQPELGDARRRARAASRAACASSSRGMPRVALEDGREEPVGRQVPHVVSSSHANGIASLLEVVAKGEVAEHLEERVMAQRRADVVEVVVLAADAHALLRGGRARVGALLAAEEHVLELVHAGVREEQRRIVVRARAASSARWCGRDAGSTRGNCGGCPWNA